MTEHEKTVNEIIPSKLAEIEEKENVKIIHCVESGSRAWGFASPDSDYDVRFIYARRAEDYLRVDKMRDVIEWQLDDTLDINGWDIQKALGLLHRSNPTLFEWNNSPIIYKTTSEWSQVQKVIDRYFSQKSGLYHYLSTAKANYREFLRGETVRLKKYFYVLRPLLACKYIIENKCPPPMLFSVLAEACLDPVLKDEVDRLISLKMSTPELGTGKRIDIINDYIEAAIPEISALIEALPKEESSSYDELNKIFRSIIK